MTLKTITCTIFMGSALMFGGVAHAQTMVGGNSVTEADMPTVQAACDALSATEAPQSIAESSDDETDEGDTGTNGGTATGTDSSGATSTGAEGTNDTNVGGIDTSKLTIEDCTNAGLTK